MYIYIFFSFPNLSQTIFNLLSIQHLTMNTVSRASVSFALMTSFVALGNSLLFFKVVNINLI